MVRWLYNSTCSWSFCRLLPLPYHGYLGKARASRVRPTTLPCKESLVTQTKARESNIYVDASGEHQDTGLMTDGSQSRQEDDTLMVDTLKPKRRTTRVAASWSVRTLCRTSKLARVVKEFDNYKLEYSGKAR